MTVIPGGIEQPDIVAMVEFGTWLIARMLEMARPFAFQSLDALPGATARDSADIMVAQYLREKAMEHR